MFTPRSVIGKNFFDDRRESERTHESSGTVARSAQTDAIRAVPPVNTTRPSVSGIAMDGETLTADRGAWTGTPPIDFGYQWRRCDANGDGCEDIAGAGNVTYEPTAADVGHTIRVEVTARNAGGPERASSLPTAVVAPRPPANTVAPTISGTARDGEQLTAQDGTWTGTAPITFAYQWQRCELNGGACADIANANDKTYTVQDADANSTLVVVVTARNDAGTASAPSTATGRVESIAPSNTTAPTIDGTARVGQTLAARPGDWTGTGPITFTYQWQRCDADAANCADIAGATGGTYAAVAADDGHALRVVVTATGPGGTASQASAATDAVQTAPAQPTAPANTVRPAIAGTAEDGATLTADEGTWTGSDPLEFAFDLLLSERMGVSMISFSQSEDVVARVMKEPYVNVCTDGLLGGRPHPRAYGTYPRILGRYVREQKVLGLEEAIRKMTSQAADAMHLADRGRIAPGQAGDLVLFDAATVIDRATFADPLQPPAGITHVVVAGVPVVADGRPTGARPGRAVRATTKA